MPMSLDDLISKHSLDPDLIETHKQQMADQVRGYRLRELREAAGLTQTQLAERIGVSQRQISKIERGDLNNSKLGTIRKYAAAIGGDIVIEYSTGTGRIQVA
ncbi:MAG: helix-turn-helix transcriptional regulator [Rhodococcus sp.]|nr:helix-turn-helix transcriptional regulator [Rhodococcus sp. (in: high G+C Gram-positive bacteria)]